MSMRNYLVGSATKKRKKNTSSSESKNKVKNQLHGWESIITEAFTYENEEERCRKEMPDGRKVDYKYLHCNVPDEDGKICDKTIPIQAGTGTGNAFKHILKSHFNENKDELAKAYIDALEKAEEEGCAINTVLKCDSYKPKELAMIDWVELVVMENLPIDAVENAIFRRFCRHDEVFGDEMFRETLFQLMILVEQEIKKEMEAESWERSSYARWLDVQ